MKPITRVVFALAANGVKLWLEDGQLRYQGPEDALESADFAELRERKAEAIEYLEQVSHQALPPFVPKPRPDRLPLSFHQLEALRADRDRGFREHPALQYHLTGELDLPVFEACVRHILRRHEILRTRYILDEGEVRQEIMPQARSGVELVDLEDFAAADQNARLLDVIRSQGKDQFDLAAGIIFSCKLVRLSRSRHVLSLAAHSVAADVVSLSLFGLGLSAEYEARKRGAPSPLPPLTAYYADYALWEREVFEAQGADLDYWNDYLQGAQALDLPLRCSREKGPFKLARAAFEFSDELAVKLEEVERQVRIPGRLLLLASIAAVFRHWGRHDGVVVGYGLAGRPPGAERMVGPFFRTRPLLIDLNEDAELVDLLSWAIIADIRAVDFRRPMVSEIIQEFHLDRVWVNIFPVNPGHSTVGLEAHTDLQFNIADFSTEIDLPVSYDMKIQLWITGSEISGMVSYATDLFTKEDMLWFTQSVPQVLDHILQGSTEKLYEILRSIGPPPT